MALYLVTGGAGFIGSHIVEELVRRGHSIRIIDDLSTGRKGNLSEVLDRVDFQLGSICDPEKLRQVTKGVDYVIHLAALSSVARSVEDPLSATNVNLVGTLQVLLAAREARVKRVVMAATAAAYGDSPASPLVETQTPDPLSPYALAKLAGEYYGKIFQRLFALEFVALRYFNVFGPRQNPESPYSGVISKFIASYLVGGAPTIFGNGEQSRDFVFVANVVKATLLACVRAEAAGKVINIGTGIGITLNQTIRLLNQIMEVEIKPNHEPRRLGDIMHSTGDVSVARVALGYEPIVSFEEGLRRTIAWLQTEMNCSPRQVPEHRTAGQIVPESFTSGRLPVQ